MARRRRDNRPDNRLDWRDTDMWVVRKVYEDAPMLAEPKVTTEYVYPGEVEEQAQENMRETRNPNTPHWSKDPTYDLAKRRRR